MFFFYLIIDISDELVGPTQTGNQPEHDVLRLFVTAHFSDSRIGMSLKMSRSMAMDFKNFVLNFQLVVMNNLKIKKN